MPSRKNLDQIEHNNWISISIRQVFKMQFGRLICRVISLYWSQKRKHVKSNLNEAMDGAKRIQYENILTDNIRFRTESRSFLRPEKGNWTTHLHNGTHLSFAWPSFFVEDNLLCLHIICNPAPIIDPPFQITAIHGKTKDVTKPITSNLSNKSLTILLRFIN